MKKAICSLAFLGAAYGLQAQTISTYGEEYQHPIQNYASVVQSFAAAGPELLDYRFNISGDTTGDSVGISIYNWSFSTFNGNTVGPALYSTSIVRPTTTSDIVLSGIDVPMTTGSEYAVIFDLNGNTNNSLQLMIKQPNTNPTGNAFFPFAGKWDSYNYDTEFAANFGAVPEPAPLFAFGLGFVGLLVGRRKR